MAIIGYAVLEKDEHGIGGAVYKYVKSIVCLKVYWTFNRKDALEFNDTNERFNVIDFIRNNAIVSDMSRLVTG